MQARKEMINMQNAKLAYTVEEASKSTGIGKNTLRNLIEWKKIPVIKVGRKFLIKKMCWKTSYQKMKAEI